MRAMQYIKLRDITVCPTFSKELIKFLSVITVCFVCDKQS